MSKENSNKMEIVKRRDCLKILTAAGIGVSGLGGLSTTASAQEVTAIPCGEFSSGPQTQQCIQCVEEQCPEQEVHPLFPLYNQGGDFDGICFTPPEGGVPDGAEWVTLKAGQNCFVSPVQEGVTYCLPEGSQDISNATFYRCGGEPTPVVDNVEVTCQSITITTSNIPDGEMLDVTVTFEDGSVASGSITVDADGVAQISLPGDLNPAHLTVVYEGETLFDEDIEASDGPCKRAECPPGLNIAYTFKYGQWWPDTHDDIGDEVDPDVFSIEGDRKEVTICAPFPFAVVYATRKKDHDDWDSWNDWDDWTGKKKKDHCPKHKHKHKSCDCFDDCKECEPVLAEKVDSQYCATIPNTSDYMWKKKKEICWFRVFCPESGTND